MRLWMAFVVLVGVGLGCAARPESIAPAYVSHMTYMGWTCDQLAEEQMRLVAALATCCDAQRNARSNDTVGVILIGLPVSSLSGSNQAAQVARLKGELEAVQKAGTLKDCHLKPFIDPSLPKAQRQKLEKKLAAADPNAAKL